MARPKQEKPGQDKPEQEKPEREVPATKPRLAIKERMSAWRRRLTRRTVIVALLIVLGVGVSIAAYVLYAAITQDLVLVLVPGATALSLHHNEQANVSFDLSTNNYLFCEAACTYRLLDLSSNMTIGAAHTIRAAEGRGDAPLLARDHLPEPAQADLHALGRDAPRRRAHHPRLRPHERGERCAQPGAGRAPRLAAGRERRRARRAAHRPRDRSAARARRRAARWP